MGTGPEIEIAGGGPAGAAAALAALAEGSAVRVFEKSQFPRHKVCGEFLSPEILGVFDRLGVSEDFLALRPSRIHRARLHFGRRAKSWVLAEPAYGLSRSALDHLLLSIAEKRGAEVRRAAAPERSGDALRIAASGRRSAAEKGSRLFGFKAHFRGPCDDGVDLVFFNRCYAGVSAVEDGVVNICGLAPEAVLGAHGFDPDRLIAASPVLNERARGLSRTINWLITGPVVFRDAFDQPGGVYLAGDALGFVDPFTGWESWARCSPDAWRDWPRHAAFRLRSICALAAGRCAFSTARLAGCGGLWRMTGPVCWRRWCRAKCFSS